MLSNPPTAAEVVVFTTPPINLIVDSAEVWLMWFINFQPGATTTNCNVKIRRGPSISSTAFTSTWGNPVAAGNQYSLSGFYIDVVGGLAEVQYSLTMTMVGATAGSSLFDGMFAALVL